MDFTKREGGPIISGEMDLGWYNLDSESVGLNRIFLQKNEYTPKMDFCHSESLLSVGVFIQLNKCCLQNSGQIFSYLTLTTLSYWDYQI